MFRTIKDLIDQLTTDLARPGGGDQADIEAAVRRVFEQVRADGDSALRALTRRFDGVEVGAFEVTADEFARAEEAVTPALRAAMVEARGRLLAWHRGGMAAPFELETAPGVSCGRVLRPIGWTLPLQPVVRNEIGGVLVNAYGAQSRVLEQEAFALQGQPDAVPRLLRALAQRCSSRSGAPNGARRTAAAAGT